MAIDQRDVSSKLRFMEDGALQQYAAMHKNDPYIFPLAFQESQNRQRLRMQQQAQAGAQPQPKVADQALAQMAPPQAQPMPEDQGIATLPAPNMKFGAEGGIMGYEGYGEEPQQFGQEPVLRMAGGGHVQGYSGAAGSLVKAGPEFVRFLQNIGVDYADFARLGAGDKAALADMFEQSKAGAPAAAPAAQAGAAQGASKAYTAGQAARPYLDKAGKVVKAGAVPVVGAGLSAAQGLSEVDSAQAFYNDPNVPTVEKAKQFARTGVNVAAPYVGGVIGSGIAPVAGTIGGAALGAGVAALVDDEGEALKQYRAKNEPAKGPTEAQNRSALNKADAARFATPGENSASTAEKPAAKKDDAASKPDTTRRNTSDPSAVRTDPSAARKESAPATTDVTGMFETALEKADKKANPYEEQIKAVNAAKVKAGEENVSGLEAIQKQFSDIYKGKKERLDTRENEIGKMKDQSLGLALLNAGAAMMSTRGSIGQAIGAGIDTGSKQYVAGLDKINAAKDKLSDARDRLEEIEAQRGELSARELHKARNEVKSLTTAGMENLIQAAMAERKINRAEAVDFVKAQLTVSTADKDRSSREDIANMQERGQSARSAAQIAATLNTPDRLVFNQLVKDNGNDPVKAAEALQKLKAEKFNMYEAYSKYLAGFAGKENLMKGPDDFDVFAKRFIPTVTPSKNTTVRKQPGG